MSLQVRTDGGTISLRWYEYNTDCYRLLVEMQRVCPNQYVELADGRFLRCFNLQLDPYELRNLNAGASK